MAITNKFVTSAGAGGHTGADLANAFSFTEMITDINATGKAGNRYNVIGAVSRTTTADSITSGGSATSPVVIRFGAAAAGDAYLGRTNTNGPLITTNMPVLSYTTGSLVITGTFIILESFNYTGATAGPVIVLGADCAIVRSVGGYTGTDATGTVLTTNLRSRVIDNDLIMAGASGGLAAINAASSPTIRRNRIKGKTAPCITIPTSGSPLIDDNIIYRGTNGIATTNAAVIPNIVNNLIVNNTADGINYSASITQEFPLIGNRITDNGGWGVNANGAQGALVEAFNRFDRNVSGATTGATDWITATSYNRDTTSVLIGAEYMDATNDDYRLVSGAPATGGGSFAQVAQSSTARGLRSRRSAI